MTSRQGIRRDLETLAGEARVRSRAYRALLQVLIAGIASVWVGWWALVWIAVIQIVERFIEPYFSQQVIANLAATNARKAELAAASLRAFTASVYALGWAPAWAIGGDAAGFFAGAMLVGAFVNALIYFSNSRLLFAAAMTPPLVAGFVTPALSFGLSGVHLLILPTLLVAWLRTQRAQRDQMELFESVDRNRVARVEAEQANRAKTQFMATVTHELRTPLNAIINYAEMLEEDLAKGEPSLARDAARIGGAGKGLLGLIENVLNYTMIETGDLKLMPVSTDVRAVFASVVEVAAPLAKANNNALNAILSPDIDIEMVDERRLRECLSALLNNACRFTRDASVVISAGRLQTPSGRWLEFVVDDCGCGISVEQQQNLFEPFSQADGALTRKHDGFGLGLAVTQRLARLMGGDLKLQSKAEPGARFVLTIACGVPDDQEAAARSIAR